MDERQTDSTRDGQVSEVGRLDPEKADEPIYPDQATAGYPETESGAPDEGSAGPNARPRHDDPATDADDVSSVDGAE